MLAQSVALPEAGSSGKNLKRTASVASLPTPPRTQRRRQRKGRVSDGSSEEELPVLEKKLRLSRVEDQEAFWLGKKSEKAASSSSSWSSDEEDGVPAILQRRKDRDAASDYASPPPSNRKVSRNVRTPHPKTSLPIRDSPNNPFLDSPPASGSGGSVAVESDEDDGGDGGDIGTHPTITYVHRGVRRTFPNPYHDPTTGLPRPPNPNSLLPPEHPDYEPDLRCVRKVLFPGPEGSRKRRRGRHAKEKKKKVVDSSDEDMETSKDALLMAPGPPRRRKLDDSW